jgi:hypothetical protein
MMNITNDVFAALCNMLSSEDPMCAIFPGLLASITDITISVRG